MEIGELDLFIGKKLRTFRSKFKWPLKTLADEIGISLQQLQRYELGENKISATMLYKITKIFNVKIEAFFTGFNHPKKEKNSNKSLLNLMVIEDDADDEFLLRKAISEYKKPLNIYVIHCMNETMNFCRTLEPHNESVFPKPNLIILDICIAKNSRFEILSYIKKNSFLKEVPVVIFTNNLRSFDIKEAYKLQASGLIKKSLDYNEFKSQLFKTLDYWVSTVLLP